MTQETRFQELKRYVRFTEVDASLLGAFRDQSDQEFPRIALEFYDRIREHVEAHRVFTGEEQIQRLQSSLVLWLNRICSGPYDDSYQEQTSQIGRVHVRIGLPQRYMFTAMALIRIALLQIADRRIGDSAGPTRDALNKVLDIELAVMLDTYRDAYVDRIQQSERQERRDVGGELARAKHRYVNAVELSNVLTVGLDRNGTVQLFNREAERTTGFARDEVFGLPFVTALKLEDLAGELPALLAKGLSGELPSQVCETTLCTRAGKVRDVVWHLSFAGEQADDEVVMFAMGQDLTDKKAMQERTRQAEKLAAIGTLAAGLAHEIRNPLNGAQLHVSFLERAIRRQAPDQEMLEATTVVADEIRRLANLVSEFLDFARPKPLQVKPVSLIALCEHARTMASPLASTSGVQMRCDLPGADVEFRGDQDKLLQVLLNLLTNAIEAIVGSTGQVVTLRGRREPRHVMIEVEDDGPGVPTADAPIFDAFYSTKEGGTGLGLAITHRIVTDHGGSIDVLSRSGATTFRVRLPLNSLQEIKS